MSTHPNQQTKDSYYTLLKSRFPEVEARYRQLTPESARLNEEAKRVQPGGSTRDAVLRHPYPVFLTSGNGGWVTDVDGRFISPPWVW